VDSATLSRHAWAMHTTRLLTVTILATLGCAEGQDETTGAGGAPRGGGDAFVITGGADGEAPVVDAARGPDARVDAATASGSDGAPGVDLGADSGPDRQPDAEPDARPDTGPDSGSNPRFCVGRANGLWCDDDEIVRCRDDAVASRERCANGCEQMPQGVNDRCAAGSDPDPDFCDERVNGLWCDGGDLVRCRDAAVATRERCPNGCEQMPPGVNDRCRAPDDPPGVDFCMDVPPMASRNPPDMACNYMDWALSPDGFYLVSQFGTTSDPTTLGHGTTCGFLQGHYDGHNCRYDNRIGGCLPGDWDIPWVRGDVDYPNEDVLAAVDRHLDGDVPTPDFFYVADAQRFGCGAVLRVSSPDTGRCVVVYTEDGGPGTRYELADRGGRRILDASPAVPRYLQLQRWGWANSSRILVEWGLPNDVPGQACVPCESVPAAAGSEDRGPPYDVEHMMPEPCR